MRPFLIVFALFLASCGGEQKIEVMPPVQEPIETYATTNINGFEISLRNEGGQCVLFFSRSSKSRSYSDKRAPLDMAAPCNFIHRSGSDELEFFEFGDKAFRYKIFIVVGGPPDPEFPDLKDRFMPNGCGTSVQKILIYDDRIRIDYPAFRQSPPYCPSEPIDEVFFAT
ncbi:MAG TPA: hypothetical protein VEV84_00080 [Pyrinomonadaceae bacterium]|nr:hypothetical protein [Pyrinomonadaceae bacterium]